MNAMQHTHRILKARAAGMAKATYSRKAGAHSAPSRVERIDRLREKEAREEMAAEQDELCPHSNAVREDDGDWWCPDCESPVLFDESGKKIKGPAILDVGFPGDWCLNSSNNQTIASGGFDHDH